MSEKPNQKPYVVSSGGNGGGDGTGDPPGGNGMDARIRALEDNAVDVKVLLGRIDTRLGMMEQYLATKADLEAGKVQLQAVKMDLGSKIESARADLGRNIDSVKSELSSDIALVRTDLTASITAVRTDLDASIATARSDLGTNIATARSDLGANIATARTDLGVQIAAIGGELKGKLGVWQFLAVMGIVFGMAIRWPDLMAILPR